MKMNQQITSFEKAGLIAGIASGIFASVILSVSVFISLYPYSPDRALLLFMTFFLLYSGGFFALGAVFGSLFGLLFKYLYQKIPIDRHYPKVYLFGIALWLAVQLLNFPNYDLFNAIFTLALFVLVFSSLLGFLTRRYFYVHSKWK